MDTRKKKQIYKMRKEKATADDLVTNKSALSLNSSVFNSDYESIVDTSSESESSFSRQKPHLDAANLLLTISKQQSRCSYSSKDQSPAESEIYRAVKTFMDKKNSGSTDRN